MQENFSRLTAYLDSLVGAGVPGCDMIVCRGHEVLYRHAAGFRDAERRQPVREDDIYRLYSCTKLFTTCAVMQLIERGVLHLDDAVRDWLPAYGAIKVQHTDGVRPAKRVMTVRHLMSMQSGLDYEMNTASIQAVMARTGGMATTRELVDAKAEDPLRFEPGEDFLYSLSHDVLGALIEAATGERFSDYLKKNIFDPLGLRSTAFALNEANLPRLSAEYVLEGDTNRIVPVPALSRKGFRISPNYESGGGGLLSDVRDYGRFADALACGGIGLNGARILSPEMIQLWSANQLMPRSRRSFDAWRRQGYSYALGVRTRVDTRTGGLGPIGEFGWDGYAGAWTMVDPIHCVSAFYAMHVGNWNYCYDVIHPTLRNLIYEALGAMPG